MIIRPSVTRPFPGIRPFTKDEECIFHGRGAMIDAVLDLLASRQFVVVHGSSGCGKSSLIKAGVLPRLEREHRLHMVEWVTAQMRPGSAPIVNLAEAFARIAENIDDENQRPSEEATRKFRRLLSQGEDALDLIGKELGTGEGCNVCLLIDQFEEIFRYSEEISPEESEIFTTVLRGFSGKPPQGLHAIVTMRSDFLGDCAQFVGFAELVNHTQYLLPRLNERQMMRAISQPAEDFDGEVDIALAVRMIAESRRMPDALPLIQHCLMYLWTEAKQNETGDETPPFPVLKTDDFLGLSRTLSARADAVLEKLGPGHEKIAEHLFRAITTIDAQGRAIRRPQRRSALLAITGGDEAAFERVLAAFANPDTGFLVASQEPDPMLDITHEALIRCWDRLTISDDRSSGWMTREQEDEQIWRALVVLAESEEFVGANILDDRTNWFNALPSEAWAERHGGQYQAVKQLLKRSEAKKKADEARDKRVFRGLVAAVGIFAVLAAIAFWSFLDASESAEFAKLKTAEAVESLKQAETAKAQAVTAREKAIAARNSAETEKVKAQEFSAVLSTVLRQQWQRTEQAAVDDPYMTTDAATRRALAAIEFLPDANSQELIRRTLPEDPTVVQALRAALGSFAPSRRENFGEGEIDGLAVSRDGALIAVAVNDGDIRIHRTEDFSLVNTIDDTEGIPLRGIRFSLDNTQIYSSDSSESLYVRDINTGRILLQKELGGNSRKISLTPDGRFLAAIADPGRVMVWRLPHWELVLEKDFFEGEVWGLALSPDGERLLMAEDTGDSDVEGKALVADMSGRVLAHFDVSGDIAAVDWASDGKTFATSGAAVEIWDAATYERRKIVEDVGSVWALAYSPDGTQLAYGDNDKDAMFVIPVEGDTTTPVFDSGQQGTDLDGVAWSPDAGTLFVGMDDGTLIAYDVSKKHVPKDAGAAGLIVAAREMLPVCFSERERERLQLFQATPLEWCIDQQKPPYDAQGRFDYAISLIEEGNLDQADEVFERAAQIDPELGQRIPNAKFKALVKYAATSFEAERTEEGRKAYNRARTIDPTQFAKILPFELDKLARLANNLLIDEYDDQARKIFDEIIRLDKTRQDFVRDLLHEYSMTLDDPEISILLSLEAQSRTEWPDDARLKSSKTFRRFPRGEIFETLSTPFDDDNTVYGVTFLDPAGTKLALTGYASEGQSEFIATAIDFPEGAMREAYRDRDDGVDVSGVRIALNPDKSQIAVALFKLDSDAEKVANIWDIASGELLFSLSGGSSQNVAIEWSPDGRWIATGNSDSTVQIWDAASGELYDQHDLHDSGAWDLAFSPDSRLLASRSESGEVAVIIWDIENKSEVTRENFHDGNDVYIGAFDWSADGDLIASGDENGSIVIWSVETQSDVRRLELDDAIDVLAFSPDGAYLATASVDAIRIWKDDEVEHIRRFENDFAPNSIAWSANGNRIVVGGEEGDVAVWDLGSSNVTLERLEAVVTRCLTTEERKKFYLPPEKPEWCKRFVN